ncbi:DUF748 domain-containing protein [Anaeromyxobacter paludicola]|uniref:DUF748 domain-containing protein n=1 Tax=Anaeromyxobacter paludicola TaxID=2918171 RepID=A0ABM7X973_9BACT|nr:DUF748 domain-containing protein [Anaeromyxobacter paludicola]BDG08398.1 hypothetical protein AMPC_15110 [Anaeromyxobacter paludicola]
MARESGHRTRRRGWLIALGVLVLLLVAGRVALNPLAAARVRHQLSQLRGMTVTFSDLSLSVFRLHADIRDLKIVKRSAGGAAKPILYVRDLSAGLYWRQLFHGHVVGWATFERPKVNLIAAKSKSQQQTEFPDIAAQLQKLSAFRLDRLEVKDGELTFTDATEAERAELWLHGVALTVENVATRPALQRGSPTVLAMSGTLQRTGQLSVYASADPLAKGLTFAGQARLTGLDLRELASFLAAKSGLEPAKGTLDLSVRFAAESGKITGGLRPVLKDPSVKAKPDAGLFKRLEAAVADVALDLFSDRVPGRHAVATTIPIRGDVSDPKAQVWPTIFGVLRNAFVTGVMNSVAGLPPRADKG